jgi:hypothetical protein
MIYLVFALFAISSILLLFSDEMGNHITAYGSPSASLGASGHSHEFLGFAERGDEPEEGFPDIPDVHPHN